jgi:hypothetical protein
VPATQGNRLCCRASHGRISPLGRGAQADAFTGSWSPRRDHRRQAPGCRRLTPFCQAGLVNGTLLAGAAFSLAQRETRAGAPTVARARADLAHKIKPGVAHGRIDLVEVGDRMAGRLVLRQVSADAAECVGASPVHRLYGWSDSHRCRQTLAPNEGTGHLPEGWPSRPRRIRRRAPKPSSSLRPRSA